jgi:hypothetical protein
MVQFFPSCQAQKTCTDCGVVIRKARFFDPAQKKFIAISQNKDMTMWYKDSLVIQEVNHIYQKEDENHNITWEVITERYKFVDLRTKEIYEYYSFSDTSKMIKKCAREDTGCARETWAIWTETHGFMPDREPIKMSDTIINDIKYRRVMYEQLMNTSRGVTTFFVIGYLRCDLKKAVLMYDKQFSKKMGCPLIRFDEYYSPPLYEPDYGECEYLPRKLNARELKIFATWEKSARKSKTHD